ncbi:MAG TPA: LysR family transcriptional regulator [Methylibium sp.]|nr:LysR family transcriptional regulator [Methylibium sp.]
MTDTFLPAPATARAPDVRMAYWWATPGERRPAPARPLYHPLFALLDAVRHGGSIKAAAATLGLSYRHVWGELRRWEAALGRALLNKAQGQRAALTPFADRLLEIERSTQARFAPQLEAMRRELEHALVAAYDG